MKPIILTGAALAWFVSPALAPNPSGGLTCRVTHDQPANAALQTWDYEFLPDPSKIAQTMSSDDHPNLDFGTITVSLRVTPSTYVITDDDPVDPTSRSRTTIDRQTGHLDHIATLGEGNHSARMANATPSRPSYDRLRLPITRAVGSRQSA